MAADGRHPALVWAASGLMGLTGLPDGPPALASGHWLQRLQRVADDIATLRAGLRGIEKPPWLDAAAVLGERAAVTGTGRRRGSVSLGGACRMLAAADRPVAVSLTRAADVEMLPAWLGVPPDATDPWSVAADAVATMTAAEVADRAAPLGVAVGVADHPVPPDEPDTFGDVGPATDGRRLVVDLSALWAGPLCAALLGESGFDVVKVSGPRRPDGARFGSPAFYRLLNGAKTEQQVNLNTLDGRRQLLGLLGRAAVVVDGMRPRVWANLGWDPPTLAAEHGLVWVSITGHGDNRAAFGDDAAVAGGLWLADPAGGLPWFVADAAADPAAGLVACRGALRALTARRAGHLQVAMSRVAAWTRGGTASHDLSVRGAELIRRGDDWAVRADGEEEAVAAPRQRDSVDL